MKRLKRKDVLVILEKVAKELSGDKDKPSSLKVIKVSKDEKDVCFSVSEILEKKSLRSPVVFANVVAQFTILGHQILSFYNGVQHAKIVSNDDSDKTLEKLFGKSSFYNEINEDNTKVLLLFISMIKKIVEDKYNKKDWTETVDVSSMH